MQAGFVLHKKDPVVSTSCGCKIASQSCNLLSASLNLTVNDSSGDMDEYCNSWINAYEAEGVVCTDLTWTYEYNSTKEYCAQRYYWQDDCRNKTVGATTPPINSVFEPEVTIWYNNQVGTCTIIMSL